MEKDIKFYDNYAFETELEEIIKNKEKVLISKYTYDNACKNNLENIFKCHESLFEVVEYKTNETANIFF